MSNVKTDLGPEVRVQLGPDLREFVKRFTEGRFPDQKWALRWVLNRLNSMVVSGEIAQLGPEFAETFAAMRTDTSEIDLAQLHRSDRTKSGFVGVYANGKGFRAMGSSGHCIGTFPTSEQAAWARYKYYRANALTYGPLEEWLVKAERDMHNDLRNALEVQGADMPLAYRRFAIYTAAQNRIFFDGLSAEDKVYERLDPMETYFSVP